MRHSTKLLSFILILLTYPTLGISDDSVVAQYVIGETDSLYIDKKEIPILNRVYSSRRVTTGILGTGWCTPLDEKLKLASNGTLLYYSCQRDLPYEFHLQSTPVTDKKGGDSLFFQSKRLQNTAIVRTKNQYKILTPNASYTFYLKGGFKSFSKGSFTFRVSPAPFPSFLKVNDSISVKLFWNKKLNRLTKIGFGTGNIMYRYKDDNLIQVKTPKALHNYSYDDYSNMILVQKNGVTTAQLTYDTNSDRLTFVNKGRCQYSQTFLKSTQIRFFCKNKIPVEVTLNSTDQVKEIRSTLGSVKIQYDPLGNILGYLPDVNVGDQSLNILLQLTQELQQNTHHLGGNS